MEMKWRGRSRKLEDMEKSKLKCEMIWKIWIIQKKIVKRYVKYGRNPS
jgi:hypothetical protein